MHESPVAQSQGGWPAGRRHCWSSWGLNRSLPPCVCCKSTGLCTTGHREQVGPLRIENTNILRRDVFAGGIDKHKCWRLLIAITTALCQCGALAVSHRGLRSVAL